MNNNYNLVLKSLLEEAKNAKRESLMGSILDSINDFGEKDTFNLVKKMAENGWGTPKLKGQPTKEEYHYITGGIIWTILYAIDSSGYIKRWYSTHAGNIKEGEELKSYTGFSTAKEIEELKEYKVDDILKIDLMSSEEAIQKNLKNKKFKIKPDMDIEDALVVALITYKDNEKAIALY